MNEYLVNILWDEEADRWVALGQGFGLALNSGSLDALMERVKVAIPDIIDVSFPFKVKFQAEKVSEVKA